MADESEDSRSSDDENSSQFEKEGLREDEGSSGEDFAFEDSFNQDDRPSKTQYNEGKQDAQASIAHNKEYDEALDVSASTMESHDVIRGANASPGRNDETAPSKQSEAVQNASYDEALEVSASTIGSMEIRTPGHKGGLAALDTKTASPDRGARGAMPAIKQNCEDQPWDETHSVSSDEAEHSLDTDDGLGFSGMNKGGGRPARGDSPPAGASASSFGQQEYGGNNGRASPGSDAGSDANNRSTAGSAGESPLPKRAAAEKLEKLRPLAGGSRKNHNDFGSDEGGGDNENGSDTHGSDSSSDSDGGAEDRKSNAGYKSKNYDHLECSDEVRDLFQYIGRYKPPRVELETRLRCFIPDFIPAVGDIDAFIKIVRPDGQRDDLGLVVVDEPAAQQSDATVLELQLRSISKKSNLGEMSVRSIERADKNPKEITKWIDSIEDLHRRKPPPQVNYSKNMPDIEQLMQVWPEGFEELLRRVQLPTADADLSVHEYARTVCGLLDIPVYKSHVEALHVLFTLFLEFRNNSHFRSMGGSFMAETSPRQRSPASKVQHETMAPQESKQFSSSPVNSK